MPENDSYDNDTHQQSLGDPQALSDILANAPIGIFTSLSNGRLIYANDAMARMFGYHSPKDLIDTVKDIGQTYVDPADRDMFKHLLETHGEVVNHECRRLQRDGSVFWISINARAVRDKNGKISHYQGFNTNITKRKQAEEKLGESEERFKTIIENLPGGVFAHDFEGRFLFVNEAASKNTGYSEQELLNMSVQEIDASNFSEEEIVRLRKSLHSGKSVSIQTTNTRKDGTEFPAEIYLNTITLNEQPIVLTIAYDITERKQAEEALQRVRFSINNLADAVFWIDENGCFTDVNEGACRKLGYTREELLTMCVADIDPDFPREKWASHWEEMKRCGSMVLETRHRTKDGTIIPMEVLIHNQSFENSCYNCVIGRDITERKRAEEHILQLQKAESLSRMAGAVAHHYNNLLTTVMGNLELAMMDLPKDTEPGVSMAEALCAGHRASELGNLMLAYLGQTMAHQETLDLCELCRQSIADLRIDIPEHVTMETVLPSPGPPVSANAAQINQVIKSLLLNALEAICERPIFISISVLTIASDAIPAKNRFPIAFQPVAPGYACLEIMDAGCGIAEKEIENLFDPFYSTKFTGRGLGLPVTLGTVKAHKGCITVESKPDQGSVFRVYLPIATVIQNPRTKQLIPESAIQQEGGTVLLVEDQPKVRQISVRMLSRLGMTTLEAKDGFEAIEIFRHHKEEICCVLCDLTMPRMNGWETLTALRRIDPRIPVILTSGYDQAHIMEGARSEMPQAFLAKPYPLARLEDALTTVLRVKERQR